MKLLHLRQTMNQWLSRGKARSEVAGDDSIGDLNDHSMQTGVLSAQESTEPAELNVERDTRDLDRRGIKPKVIEWRRRVLVRKGARLHASMLERSDGGSLAMLDSLGMVVCWYDGAKGLKASPENAVLSQHVSQFYVPADVATNVPAAHLKRAASSGSSTEPGWRQHSDGSTYWAITVIQAIALQGGPVQGFSHIVRESDDSTNAQIRTDAQELQQHEGKRNRTADADSYGVIGAGVS